MAAEASRCRLPSSLLWVQWGGRRVREPGELGGSSRPTMENGCHSDSWPSRLHWAGTVVGRKGLRADRRPGGGCVGPLGFPWRSDTDRWAGAGETSTPSPLPVCEVPEAQGGLADHPAWLLGAKTQTETRPRPPIWPGVGILTLAHGLHVQYTPAPHMLTDSAWSMLASTEDHAPGHPIPQARA